MPVLLCLLGQGIKVRLNEKRLRYFYGIFTVTHLLLSDKWL